MTAPVPDSGWWDRVSIRETALMALAVLFCLQLLRVLLNSLVFYIRDSLGAGSFIPGGYALVLFLGAFLAIPMVRLLGSRRALLLTAGGLAAARLAEQFVPWPVVDLALTTAGVILFLLFLPVYARRLRTRGVRGGQSFALGLLLGIAVDTAIKGAFSTLDMSWQPGVASFLLMVFLLGGHALLLRRVLEEEMPATAEEESGALRWVPLSALGAILFLELLLFQNIGQQTALIEWDQPAVFLWVMVGNVLGLIAAVGVLARPVHGGRVAVLALAGLFVLLVVGERSGIGAAFIALFGQVAVGLAVGTMGAAIGQGVVDAAAWRVLPRTIENVGPATRAAGAGMLVLLALVFLYYVNYQLDVPGGTSAVPPIAGAVIFLCTVAAVPVLSGRESVVHLRVPLMVAVLPLLVIPLGYWAYWGEPEPSGTLRFPMRVVSYNLHQGFDIDGYLAIQDLADAIKEEQPDVVALQEVSRGWVINGSFDMLPWLSRELDMPYVWAPAADSVWGNAILTRYPISESRVVPMPNNASLQLDRSYAIAEVPMGDGGALTVIVTHLHNVEDEGHLRTPQVMALLDAWGGKDRTVLLGDLNAQPTDPEMILLQDAGMVDAFVASPGSLGQGYTTASGELEKRIDYIWVSRDLVPRDFSIFGGTASDHLGVAVTLDR